MTLTEFLLQRIAEDEMVAEAAAPDTGEWSSYELDRSKFGEEDTAELVERTASGGASSVISQSLHPETVIDLAHIARWDPARVLAECQAKRAIVEEYRIPTLDGMGSDEDTPPPFWVLKLLALPYAAHPDYQDWARDVY